MRGDLRSPRLADVQQFMVVIEGHGFSDVEEIELLHAPADGEPVQTAYGPCIVVSTEPLPDSDRFDGKIACRMP